MASPSTIVRPQRGAPRNFEDNVNTYFDHAAPDCVAEARAFMDLIQRTFAATAHVEVSSFIPAPAGPHPRGSFEALFTREVFADGFAGKTPIMSPAEAVARPGGLAMGPDGSHYITEDVKGRVWRVMYRGK